LRQPHLRVLDLPGTGTSLELLGELDDLRDTRSPNRMPLAQQTARRIHGNAATNAGRTGVDQLSPFPLGAEAEGLVEHKLCRCRSVVTFDYIEVVRTNSRLLICFSGADLGRPRLVGVMIPTRV
jgi:hypothetical protein